MLNNPNLDPTFMFPYATDYGMEFPTAIIGNPPNYRALIRNNWVQEPPNLPDVNNVNANVARTLPPGPVNAPIMDLSADDEVFYDQLIQNGRDALNRVENVRLNAAKRVSLMLLTQQLPDQYFYCAVNQFMGGAHDLELSPRDEEVMINHYGNDPNGAADKIECIASLSFIKDMVENRKFDHSCPLLKVDSDMPNGEYRLFVPLHDLYYSGMKVVVCRTADFNSGESFQTYYGIATVVKVGRGRHLQIRIKHSDNGYTSRFRAGQDVMICVPPNHTTFEGAMSVCKACRYDPVFRAKYFPQPEERCEPTVVPRRMPLPAVNLRPEPLQRLNDEQYHAVVASNNNDGAVCLYCQGPPGTGKTYVCAICIRERFHADPKSTFLILASSNNAANNICQAILEQTDIPPGEVHRAFGVGMHRDSVQSERVRGTCECDNKGYFLQLKSANCLKKYRVIVTTLGYSTHFKDYKIDQHHFTDIFIDEAGQALEQETLTPLALFSDRKTRVFLFGDHLQLRPFFVDGVIGHAKFNATMSTIERLAANDIYRNDPRLQFLLRENYRSTFSLIPSFSLLFYEGSVVHSSDYDANERDRFMRSPMLQGQILPMRFHVVEGQEQEVQIAGKKTFYNEMEADVVCRYVTHIHVTCGISIAAIGVVVPYRGQINHIRALLGDMYRTLYIQTVDKFQGSERSIIIISPTRSERLGFLDDYRRLNVSISRAQHMMIICGNLKTLVKDPYWRWVATYMNHLLCVWDPAGCRRNGVNPNKTNTQLIWRHILDQNV